MWGFVADSAAGKLCRVYAAILGDVPRACGVGSGVPALVVTALVIVVIGALAAFARSRMRRR